MSKWIDPSRERKTKGAYVGLSTKHSKHMVRVTKFILDRGYVPLHPTLHSQFALGRELTPKEADRQRDYFMRNCEEMWVFGALTGKVFQEIKIAKRLGKTIKYFDVSHGGEINEIPKEQVDISGIQ